jgi:GTP-binding protein YchF
MALSCGIIGLPIVGKTTFFNLLTNAGIETSAFYSGKTTTNMAHALVPDSRLDYLTEMFKPKKTTFAQIKIIDVPGLVAGSSQGQGSGNEFLQSIANVDALAHIVRAFKNDEVVHVEDSIDIMRDIDTINSELLFADLQLIETRLARINSGHKKKLEHPAEEQVLKKCQKHLENEQPLKSLEFTEEEQEALNHITFLTTKPMLIIINLDEEQAAAANWPQKEEILSWCAEQEIEVLPVCAKLEEEIQQLPAEERELFLSELGLTEAESVAWLRLFIVNWV